MRRLHTYIYSAIKCNNNKITRIRISYVACQSRQPTVKNEQPAINGSQLATKCAGLKRKSALQTFSRLKVCRCHHVLSCWLPTYTQIRTYQYEHSCAYDVPNRQFHIHTYTHIELAACHCNFVCTKYLFLGVRVCLHSSAALWLKK